MAVLIGQLYHEIQPPMDYSLTPRWMIYAAVFATLSIIGLVIWLLTRKSKRQLPPKLPRHRALEALELIGQEIDHMTPYQFSIRVSDILRSYVTEQYGLPLTRQTSVEFLERVVRSSQFSEDEKSLLQDFLNRCDLIKFARYAATTADSYSLLEEATRFVKGGQVATVS
ncbi:MAG TPA: DUF4381 family protein [Chthoniobacterales bacterium]